MREGNIHSIETFGTLDGPGIRYVIFFQGCPLRCQYCHNPDTWACQGGTKMTADQIITDFKRQEAFYRNGGITATGGEPLLQLEFLTELFQKAKAAGIHTCLDTSGITFSRSRETQYKELAKVTDYVLLDVKHADRKAHQKLTGQDNEAVFAFLDFLQEEQIPVRIRHVLIPGVTMEAESLRRLGEHLSAYKNIRELEILPYHTMGISKYRELGIAYPLEGVREPDKAEVQQARQSILEGFRRRY